MDSQLFKCNFLNNLSIHYIYLICVGFFFTIFCFSKWHFFFLFCFSSYWNEGLTASFQEELDEERLCWREASGWTLPAVHLLRVKLFSCSVQRGCRPQRPRAARRVSNGGLPTNRKPPAGRVHLLGLPLASPQMGWGCCSAVEHLVSDLIAPAGAERSQGN